MPYPINLKQAEKKTQKKKSYIQQKYFKYKKNHLFKQVVFMNFAWKILYVLVVVFPNLWLSGLCSQGYFTCFLPLF